MRKLLCQHTSQHWGVGRVVERALAFPANSRSCPATLASAEKELEVEVEGVELELELELDG